MATETTAAARWIYQTLSADAALRALAGGRIFSYRVPEGSAYPCVVFQLQTPQLDSRAIGDVRLASRLVLAIKTIGQGADFIAIQPIAARIDELIEAGSGSTVDGVVVCCVRDMPLEYLESSDAGIDYAHLGGLYRLTVQGS